MQIPTLLFDYEPTATNIDNIINGIREKISKKETIDEDTCSQILYELNECEFCAYDIERYLENADISICDINNNKTIHDNKFIHFSDIIKHENLEREKDDDEYYVYKCENKQTILSFLNAIIIWNRQQISRGEKCYVMSNYIDVESKDSLLHLMTNLANILLLI